jgi:hypothetical protein
MKELGFGMMILAVGIVMLSGALFGAVGAYQPFKVWKAGYTVKQERLIGAAEFARAEENRKILVEQARAEEEAATLVASAISIVGQAAQDFPEYREQMFIGAFSEAVQSDAIDQIIYVPTEAGIPIIEAGKRRD